MDLIATDALERHPWFAGLRPGAAGRGFDAAHLAPRLRGPHGSRSRRPAARPARRRRARQHLRLRGAAPRRHRARAAGRRRASRARPSARPTAIRTVLDEAIEAGGSTLRDYAAADGSLGYFQHRFAVYGREGEPCLRPGCRGDRAHRPGRPLDLRLPAASDDARGASGCARTRGLVRRLGALALTAALGLALWLGAGSPAQAKPPMWIVRSPHATLVLFGSIHLLPAGLDWRPATLDDALARADELWFELPITVKAGEQAGGLAGAWGVAEGQAADRDAQRRRDRAPRPGVDHAALRSGGHRPHAALDGRGDPVAWPTRGPAGASVERRRGPHRPICPSPHAGRALRSGGRAGGPGRRPGADQSPPWIRPWMRSRDDPLTYQRRSTPGRPPTWPAWSATPWIP